MKEVIDALKAALEILSCNDEHDHPGHRCSYCDDYVDRNGTVRAQLREAIKTAEVVQSNPWQEAIDNELVVCHLGTTETYSDPRDALLRVINWHVAVALDPAVSEAARSLQARKPMTNDELHNLWNAKCHGESFWEFEQNARAVEAFHHISDKDSDELQNSPQ